MPETWHIGPTLASMIEATAARHGLQEFVPQWVTDPTITSGTDAVRVIGAAAEVAGICKAVGKPELAAGFITARTTPDEVRAQILESFVAADEDTRIDPALGPAQPPAKPYAPNTAAIYAARSRK